MKNIININSRQNNSSSDNYRCRSTLLTCCGTADSNDETIALTLSALIITTYATFSYLHSVQPKHFKENDYNGL